jgi:hypothetical protein
MNELNGGFPKGISTPGDRGWTTPSTGGSSCYLDPSDGSTAWETLVGAPMVEPALRAADVRPRNSFYAFGNGLPPGLFGPDPDAALFAQEHPANRAIRNAARIRAAGLPIYLEAGDEDLLMFQDGTEFLHRVLWDLDLSHEYRLIAGADHVGPTLLPRMRDAFLWLGARLAPAQAAPPEEAERLWAHATVEDPTTTWRFGHLPPTEL